MYVNVWSVLECQWLRTFRCAGALARSGDRSDALRTLRALDRTIESLIARAMRERSEALQCVARGKGVEYFVWRATVARVHSWVPSCPWRSLLRMHS